MNTCREVYGYVRVSGKSQIDGDGFPRQKEAILAFCESRGWICKRIFEEKAVPGKTEMEDRAAFMEMLGLCGGVLPSSVVVERADRVARDLIVGELIYRECAEAQVEIFAADSGEELVLANVDPTRKLIRQVIGAMAEWSKNEIVMKTRKARERIRAQTGRCEGVRPMEMLDPRYNQVVEWIALSRERGDSFGKIRKQLNLGVLKPPGGGSWQTSTIHKIWVRTQQQA